MNLRILQLGDSALPIGGFSHSWGLEAAIARGQVRDAASLEKWTRNWLVHAMGPFEGVVVAEVHRAAEKGDWNVALAANELLWTGLTPLTLRNASRDMGEQLLALAEPWLWATAAVRSLRESLPTGQWHHAPVFGTLASACGSTPTEAVAVYLHQAALGIIGAGVRAIPIGHSHGQEVLARLQDDLQTLAGEIASRPLETAGSNCPAHEVLCYEQSQLYTRLFRS
jgi:urease accessory protein